MPEPVIIGDAKIARVFPRRTNMTPQDDLAFVGGPPLWRVPCSEVHISATFSWDIPEAQRLAIAWERQDYIVRLGGPAIGNGGGPFEPGMYLRYGVTVTSRGCIRRCPWCLAWRWEGQQIRPLPVRAGHNIQDNNLLACPRRHIEVVLDMLEGQHEPATFGGGLDARLLRPWFARRIGKMRVAQVFTAYDDPGNWWAVEKAIALLLEVGLSRRQVRCFVLVGWSEDTQMAAAARLEAVWGAGALPFAMFYRGPMERRGRVPAAWHELIRTWTRPAATFAAHREDAMTGGPLLAQEGNRNT